MAKIKIKYVQEYVSDGRAYRYFRRGNVRLSLPGKPGSAEFMAAYADALIALVRAARSATIERRGADRYGRTLATLTLDGRDAATALEAAGHALPYHPGSAAWIARHKEWCK